MKWNVQLNSEQCQKRITQTQHTKNGEKSTEMAKPFLLLLPVSLPPLWRVPLWLEQQRFLCHSCHPCVFFLVQCYAFLHFFCWFWGQGCIPNAILLTALLGICCLAAWLALAGALFFVCEISFQFSSVWIFPLLFFSFSMAFFAWLFLSFLPENLL